MFKLFAQLTNRNSLCLLTKLSLPRQACELISQEIDEWGLYALVCSAGGDEEGGELLAGMERVERGACVPLDAS